MIGGAKYFTKTVNSNKLEPNDLIGRRVNLLSPVQVPSPPRISEGACWPALS